MAKVRVYELAKELEIESKDIIDFLASKGIEAKSQSGIEEDVVAQVKGRFAKKSEAVAAPAETKPAAEADKARKPRPVDKDGNPIKRPNSIWHQLTRKPRSNCYYR